MALFPRIRLRLAMEHVRDTLRSTLNDHIQDVIDNEATSPPTPSGLATVSNTTTQIQIGDHPDYEPLVYPSIRISFPRVIFNPMQSATVTDAANTFLVGVYVEEAATSDECIDEVIQTLTVTAFDLLECVRSCIEEDAPSTTYGERILVLGYERVDAPQDPERPCLMRLKYEMTLELTTRARHSRGATT